MEERENIIVLFDDEGNELHLEVLDIIEEDDNRYAVGVDVNQDEEEDTVLIMRIIEAGEDEDILEPIDDEKELQHIFDVFKERMQDQFEFVEEEEE
ncbi:MAG: DUF1292 domain-containing protein [Clostridia bacterium]|nr:DUF1292 domain-containing protein [Clostridia bacterium]